MYKIVFSTSEPNVRKYWRMGTNTPFNLNKFLAFMGVERCEIIEQNWERLRRAEAKVFPGLYVYAVLEFSHLNIFGD